MELNKKCGSTNYTDRNRRSVACHELGHVLGLWEDEANPISETCMAQPNVPANWVNRTEHAGPHDFYALHNAIYNHNDP